jgi:hypothetical protein
MVHPTGESESDALRLDFDRRLLPQFRDSSSREMKRLRKAVLGAG